jgi:hypothetical protein
MMLAASTSETSVNSYQATRPLNPEDSHFHTRCRENLKSNLISLFSEIQRFFKWKRESNNLLHDLFTVVLTSRSLRDLVHQGQLQDFFFITGLRHALGTLSGIRTRDPVYGRSNPASETARPPDRQEPDNWRCSFRHKNLRDVLF